MHKVPGEFAPRVGSSREFPGKFNFHFFTPVMQGREHFMDENTLLVITKPADGESLCRTCYWAHTQKGYRESEEITFCCFGPMRRVKFRVRDCTDYFNRTLPTRTQMEKIALIIPTQPKRKAGGFTGLGFVRDATEENDPACVGE